MKLKNYLAVNSPFKTNEDIDRLFVFIQSRNTCINEEIKSRLFESCEVDAKPYLVQIIDKYVQTYKVRPRRNKMIKKKTKALSESSESYYKREYPKSLAAMGYEYGLSDW